jgi:uncharacterized protein DUF1569
MKSLARQAEIAEILARLERVRPEQPRRWGRMTAHQMVCHLSDSFLAVMGEKPASRIDHLLNRTIVKWGALHLPLPWPPGIDTRPELDQAIGGTRPGDFAVDLALLEALLERFASPSADVAPWAHPIFGRMSRAEWLRWGWLHMDHHLRQFGD